MPELPEVETTRRGISPWVVGQRVLRVVVREPRLRWPVPARLGRALSGSCIEGVARRAKYLLLGTASGTLILHLGMSGSLRVVSANSVPRKHDHLDIVFVNQMALRLRDPRRFGCVLWTTRDPVRHRLLRGLGPEPLGPDFSGEYLYDRSRGRRVSAKSFLMDSRIVAGVGNIYASEALFSANIHPVRAAGRISCGRYEVLAEAVRRILSDAITKGGTTLRDYVRSTGDPGYFSLHLNVYGRAGEPCAHCGTPIRSTTIGQRASYYCPRCQH